MLCDDKIIRPQKQTIIEIILQKFRKKFSIKRRVLLNEEFKKTLTNNNVTIIASFCGAGTFYHDLSLQFKSPTINLAFDGKDFCKFCMNLRYYIEECELKERATDLVSYPVGYLDDVEIRFVHYKSFEEAKKKWEERCKRIEWDNIFILATDRDGMNDRRCMEMFDHIPYSKIMFTSKKYDEFSWAVYCPEFKGKQCVGVMTGIANIKGYRFYEKNVNLIEKINSNI